MPVVVMAAATVVAIVAAAMVAAMVGDDGGGYTVGDGVTLRSSSNLAGGVWKAITSSAARLSSCACRTSTMNLDNELR